MIIKIKCYFKPSLEKLSEQSENADTRGEASTTLASISTFSIPVHLTIFTLSVFMMEVECIYSFWRRTYN